jgi:excisionase family DNA binding protein
VFFYTGQIESRLFDSPKRSAGEKEMETQAAISQIGTWNSRNLLTVPEVAEWARVHPKTVYRWIKEGRLEAIQFGPRTFRIPEDAVRLFLRQVENANGSPIHKKNGGRPR